MISYTEIILDDLDRREFNEFIVDLGLEVVKLNHMLVTHITLLEENVSTYRLNYEGSEFELDLSIFPKFDLEGGTIGDYLFDMSEGGFGHNVEYIDGSTESELHDLLGKTSDLIRISVRTEDYDSMTDDTVYNVIGSIFNKYGGLLIEDHAMTMSDKAYFKKIQ